MEPVLEETVNTKLTSRQTKPLSSVPFDFLDKKDVVENAIERIDLEKESLVHSKDQYGISSYVEKTLDLPEGIILNTFRYKPTISDNDVVRWKGFVTEIKKKTFISKLFDIDAKGTYEIGQLPIEKIDRDDLSLLKIGATFYLSVGYFYNTNGQVQKKMILKFQRLVSWSVEETDEAADRATYLAKNISGETLEWK
ncbi:hypothetical protein [Telluribacter sp.]|jgi:hypothetical protein|uniref:hypothetical protein n=1 Tax=Telluribacter sp. TaxID=1978767 RepID=UPI002E1295C7|nr:hypothetical protein [Telluribacter sp.]